MHTCAASRGLDHATRRALVATRSQAKVTRFLLFVATSASTFFDYFAMSGPVVLTDVESSIPQTKCLTFFLNKGQVMRDVIVDDFKQFSQRFQPPFGMDANSFEGLGRERS